MVEKFNGVLYLILFLIHFTGYAFYGFRCVVQTQSFLDKYGMDATGAGVVRFFGCFFIGSTLMAIYVCLLYTSPSPRDRTRSRMPSSA